MKIDQVEQLVDEVIAYAKGKFEHPVFVFGDEVYTVEEARAAMIENFEDDFDACGGEIDDWKDTKKECVADLPNKEFSEHQCIEIEHQYGVTRFACKSFVEAAKNDGWDFDEFATLEDAVDFYGDAEDVPEELANMLKTGAAVVIDEPGLDEPRYVMKSDFDAESEAFDYLRHDLYSMIVINNVAEAMEIADNYHGHEEMKVRREAQKIIVEAAEGWIEIRDED